MRSFVLIRCILFLHFVISCCIKLMVLAYNKVCHLERSRRFGCVYSYVTGRTRTDCCTQKRTQVLQLFNRAICAWPLYLEEKIESIF